MSDLKTFIKADLLQIWNESPAEQHVGAFQTLERKTGQLKLGENAEYEVVEHEVLAKMRAFWCEMFKMCIVEQSLEVGRLFTTNKRLPETHLFRAHKAPRLTTIMYELSSARLNRRLVEMCDAWRREVSAAIPEDDLSTPPDESAKILQEVARQINDGALGPNVTAKLNQAPGSTNKKAR